MNILSMLGVSEEVGESIEALIPAVQTTMLNIEAIRKQMERQTELLEKIRSDLNGRTEEKR